ncbi:cysteine desulfurase family protein [Listeria valentina]|uniref:cysteine desulfurase family protein n=1 Tax=Listeria valentina TaxID=2705293 RepID=UPI001430F216|nr:cysteine desulfurase family protein [Listeria valentina]
MIYLDNSATTKPYSAVLETYTKVASRYFANPSSLHAFGQKVRELHEEARKQVAQLLGVRSDELIFTSGGTESNNLALKGIAYRYKNRGKHLITTQIEHPSVREVMRELEKDGFTVTYLPVNENGVVELRDFEQALRKDTILVSMMHVNNEVGSIQPVQEIGKRLLEHQAFFHVDNIQGMGMCELEMSAIDLVSVSGHKLHGLRGTGLLYKKKGIELHPEILGGGQEEGVRSGTENTAGAVALAKALRLTFAEKTNKLSQVVAIRDYLLKELGQMNGIHVHSQKTSIAPHILCLSASGHRGEVLVHALEKKEIFVSTTSACSSKAKLASSTLKAMGVSDDEATGAIRISLSYENTFSEAEQFVSAFQEVIEKINEVVK